MPPLLHVLIPLHPHLVVYIVVGTVAAPELMERIGGGRRGGMLSDDASREGKKIGIKINMILTY